MDRERQAVRTQVWAVRSVDKTLRMAATDFVALTKARSMLVILLATCRQTLLALDAAGNALDIDLTEDLRRMIARSETELETLNQKLKGTG